MTSDEQLMTDRMQNTDLPSEGGSPSHLADADGVSERRSDASLADDDRLLVARAQSGDNLAFGDLIDKYQRPVYGIVSRMINSRDEVDDLVQEVFVSAYGAIGKFRGEAKFSTWLHAIAVNITLNRLRQMKRKHELSIDDPTTGIEAKMQADGAPSPASAFQGKERDEAVRKAVDALPDKHRIVVVMHYFEQYSCEEIASVLKCSVGTVWSRLHYACRALKVDLRWLDEGT